MRDIDPLVWFGTRELSVVPRHFVRTTSPVTDESMIWVITKLKGRYGKTTYLGSSGLVFDNSQYLCFEDPAEAMLYELRWAG